MLILDSISWNAPDGRDVLNNLCLTIPDEKLVVITGPNGGGKTTLARIIAGIEKPSSGRVILNGEDITALDVTQRAQRGISFAFQQPVRFKGITVRKLIELAAGEKLQSGQICEILSRVGLCANEYLNREVNSTLSGGEIKRIEIATVLARHTTLSVFDEPEAGIDLWSFAKLIDVFGEMRQKLRGTLLIISHQERILNIADEIAVVSGGKIQSAGTPDKMMKAMISGKDVVSACKKQEVLFNE